MQLRTYKDNALRLEAERAKLERAVRQLQVNEEQQRTLLLETRQRLQKSNQVVMEAQRLARLEYVRLKDFKASMQKLLASQGSGAVDAAASPS